MIPEQHIQIVVSGIFNNTRQYITGLNLCGRFYKIAIFPSCDFAFDNLDEAKAIMTAFQKHAGIKFQDLLYELVQFKRTEKK